MIDKKSELSYSRKARRFRLKNISLRATACYRNSVLLYLSKVDELFTTNTNMHTWRIRGTVSSKPLLPSNPFMFWKKFA